MSTQCRTVFFVDKKNPDTVHTAMAVTLVLAQSILFVGLEGGASKSNVNSQLLNIPYLLRWSVINARSFRTKSLGR